MKKRVLTTGTIASLILGFAATSATAETVLKSGYFISNNKSIFRIAYDGFTARVN